MTVHFHKHFEKAFQKLRPAERRQAEERIVLFTTNPFATLLNNHPLQGKYKGYRSINVTGDLRAIFRPMGKDSVYFVAIDTHSKLYSS